MVSQHRPESAVRQVLVNLVDVSKVYRMGKVSVRALDRVNLEVYTGEFLVILGPSGSGKTTLLNLVGGIDSPTSGSITVNGQNIANLDARRLTAYRRHQVGFIFQFFNLIPSLTARENVEFAAELVPHAQDAMRILEEVGLGDRADHFPSELSGGEQQRVAIARALVTNPPLVLCDEPTGNLDFDTGKNILKLMRRMVERRATTFITATHNSAIADMADRVVRLRDGLIAEVRINDTPLDPLELRW